jgi:hypothetical protein
MNNRGNILLPLLFVIIAFGILLTSGAMVNKSATDPKETFDETTVSSGSSKQNLQLKNLSFSKKPTPATDSCNHDMSKKADPDKCQCVGAWLINCESQLCKEINYSKSGAGNTMTCKEVDASNWCQIFSKEGDGWYCIGKPVIYLYPQKPTFVDVYVKTEGKVVVSDPLYPEGGWKNVLANPDGTLLYQNEKYRELFYESQSSVLNPPKAGIVISKQELETKLLALIKQLGLTRSDEQLEFLEWWIPRLKALNSPYLFVSILDDDEKKRLDSVEISPKPDTFIDFIAYFKPLSTFEEVTPLVLPSTPKRIGFTAIEWGGVIDTDPTN